MKKQLLRCAGLSAAALLASTATPGSTQTAPRMPPLADVACPDAVFSTTGWDPAYAPLDVTGCVSQGTRTVEVVSQTVGAPGGYGDPFVHVTGEYNVNYDGTLVISGVPIMDPGHSGGAPTADVFFPPNSILADVTTSYHGSLSDTLVHTDNVAASSYPFFENYSNFATTLHSLTIDTGYSGEIDGNSINGRLYTPNPAAINSLSTAVSGSYWSTGDSALIVGRLAGTATLTEGPITTDLWYSNYTAPFGVTYDVQTEEMGRLDANGLVTPTVIVSDGITMNGSQVTGLGNGVAAGDAVNKGQLDAETTARVAADTAIAAAITDEATTRTAADAALATAITGEATTRAAADTAIATSIDTEVAARTASDTAIADSIVAEAATRGSADIAISQRIDSFEAERTTLATSLANETNARLAADVDLTNRINAVDVRIDMLEARLDKLDDRLASSTATAMAIQGGAFLPGKRYNLSVNVATYDGAHAGALSFAALVSSKVAVNVSAAQGFNKHGDTGVRAGLTFMW